VGRHGPAARPRAGAQSLFARVSERRSRETRPAVLRPAPRSCEVVLRGYSRALWFETPLSAGSSVSSVLVYPLSKSVLQGAQGFVQRPVVSAAKNHLRQQKPEHGNRVQKLWSEDELERPGAEDSEHCGREQGNAGAGARLSETDLPPPRHDLSRLPHTLEVGELSWKVRSEEEAVERWRTEREIRRDKLKARREKGSGRTLKKGRMGRIPDGVIVLENGDEVAVELELAPKRRPTTAGSSPITKPTSRKASTTRSASTSPARRRCGGSRSSRIGTTSTATWSFAATSWSSSAGSSRLRLGARSWEVTVKASKESAPGSWLGRANLAAKCGLSRSFVKMMTLPYNPSRHYLEGTHGATRTRTAFHRSQTTARK
jgi:hypothetical protein